MGIITLRTPFRLFIGIAIAASCSASSKTLFSQPWGRDFQITVNEMGDTISIGAMFSDGRRIFLYDQARGRIVAYDTAGGLIDSVTLEPAGRATFAADDFVIFGGRALLLNAIDRRIEIFNLSHGKHIGSVGYQHHDLDAPPKRLHRIINRIYLDNEHLALGNDRRLFYIDAKSGKRTGCSVMKAPAGTRFIGFADGKPVILEERTLAALVLRSDARNHFPIAGKQIAIVNGRACALILRPRGFSIVSIW